VLARTRAFLRRKSQAAAAERIEAGLFAAAMEIS
jgi:hypothetical protein